MIRDIHPYVAYRDSGLPWLGRIPAHWEVRRNGRLFTKAGETRFPDLPILEVSLKTGVRVRDFDGSSRKQMMAERDKYQRARKGDLAYNMMRMWQGAVGVAPVDGLVSPAYVVARPVRGADARYYEYLFRTGAYMNEVNLYSRGIVPDRNRLYWEQFKQMPSVFPPPEEQAAIVLFLGEADRKIRRYIRAKQRLIKLLEERRILVTHEAIREKCARKLRLSKIVDRVERLVARQDDETYIPIGLYNRGRGIFHKAPTEGSDLGDSTFFWIGDGDLVLSGQFAWEGAVALAARKDDGCVASHRYFVLSGKDGVVDSPFLWSYFRTEWGQLLLDCHSRGAAGRNRPLNIVSLLKEQIPVPSISAQNRIASLVQLEMQAQEKIAELTAFLREYRARLVADVVTGRLDVRDAAAGMSSDKFADLESDEHNDEPLFGDEVEDAEFSADLAEVEV